MTIVRRHKRGKSIVRSHERKIISKRKMSWHKHGRGKEAFYLEKPEDREELLDILFQRIKGLPKEQVEEVWHETEMMAHKPGSVGRQAYEEVMRKKYGKEYTQPKIITRFVDFKINPSFLKAKTAGLRKEEVSSSSATTNLRKRR